MKRKEATMARETKWGRLAIVFVGLTLFVLICGFLIQQCASCVGGSSDEEAALMEALEKQGDVEFVQLLYNGKEKIPCKVVGCELGLKETDSFKMIGVKLIGEKKVTPVSKKPRGKVKEAKETGEEVVPISINLVGEGVSFPHSQKVTFSDISKVGSFDFVFQTPYGEVPVIISDSGSGLLKADTEDVPHTKKQVILTEIKADFGAYRGKKAHFLIDSSGSMGVHLNRLWPIVNEAIKASGIKMTGLSWYANVGEVRHSKSTTKSAWSREIKKGIEMGHGKRMTMEEVMKELRKGKAIPLSLGCEEAPSPALVQVARKFKPDVIILITDEGAAVGGTSPNTNGIPVYGIAICRNINSGRYRGKKCLQDIRKISVFTRGKFKQIDPN